MFLQEFTKMNEELSVGKKDNIIRKLLQYLTEYYGGPSMDWNDNGVTTTKDYIFSLGKGVNATGKSEKYDDVRLVVSRRNSLGDPYEQHPEEYNAPSSGVKTLCFCVNAAGTKIQAYLDAEDFDLLDDTPIKSFRIYQNNINGTFSDVADYIETFFNEDNEELANQVKLTTDMYSDSDKAKLAADLDKRANWEEVPVWSNEIEKQLKHYKKRVKDTQKAIKDEMAEVEQLKDDLKVECEDEGINFEKASSFTSAEELDGFLYRSAARLGASVDDFAGLRSAFNALQYDLQTIQDLNLTLGKLNDTIEDLEYEKSRFKGTFDFNTNVRDRETNLANDRIFKILGIEQGLVPGITPSVMDELAELVKTINICNSRIKSAQFAMKNMVQSGDEYANASKGTRLDNTIKRSQAALDKANARVDAIKSALVDKVGSIHNTTAADAIPAADAEPELTAKAKRYRRSSKGTVEDAEARKRAEALKRAKKAAKNFTF